MTSKHFSHIVSLLIVSLSTIIVSSSCEKSGGSGNDPIPSGLIGTWHSTNTGSTGRSGSVTFNSDKTVSAEYSSRASCMNFEGTFTVSGETITCKGVRVIIYYSDGEETVNTDFTMTFTYSGSNLSGGGYGDCNEFSK